MEGRAGRTASLAVWLRGGFSGLIYEEVEESKEAFSVIELLSYYYL